MQRTTFLPATSVAPMIALPACGRNSRYADVARFHTNQPINRTTIGVQIKQQADGSRIREGRASKTATAGSEQTMLTRAVPVLWGALFPDFPGVPGVARQARL